MDKERLRDVILEYYWTTCYPNGDEKEFTENWLKKNNNEEFVDGLINRILKFEARTAKGGQAQVRIIPKIAEIKFVFDFAEGIAKAFDESKSSNTYFWIQQGMIQQGIPENRIAWNDAQKILDKIIKITNDSNFTA